MVEERRSLGMVILLNIITCGFYSYYFYYRLAEDMNTVCYGDGDETPGLGMYILFSIITCGIYPFYYLYKIGNRQAANGPRYNVHIQENGTTILVWLILGTWFLFIGFFVAMHIIIKNMNTLAHEYNIRNGNGGQYPNAQYPAGGLPPQGGYGAASGMNMGNSAGSVSLKCLSGEFAGGVFPLYENDNIVIGRDNSCNIKLDSNTPKVSRRHCMISCEGGRVWITDIGSTFGTYLSDGTRIPPSQKTAISRGTEFSVGSNSVRFCII